jgi:hypothetical protein
MIRRGNWPARRWPDDARQTLALLVLEQPGARAARKACALERLARDLGWVRARVDGARRWLSELEYLALAERGEVQTYRFASVGHAAARQKVAPELRRSIAAMGAAGRRLKETDMQHQLNVQVIPYPVEADGMSWAQMVQLPAREGQGETLPCQNCAGSGTYGQHTEPCRKCGGTGRAKFVLALRAEPQNDEHVAELAALLDALPAETRVQRTVRLCESGGGYTNTGHATIVCGLQGEPLVGFGGRARCDSAHAYFYVHAALVVSYGHHRGMGSGSVWLVGIDRTVRHRLGVEQVHLWRFDDGCQAIEVVTPERARDFEFPTDAVAAAQQKARCYHCRSAFFVAAGGASGPSGALTGAGAASGGLPSPLKGPGIGYEPSGS